MDPQRASAVVIHERAWISGASSGLGRAIAVELARGGTFVHLFSRGEAGLQETLRLMEGAGGQGIVHVGDVTDEARLAESLRAADAHGPGGLDLIVAGAGIAESGFGAEIPEHEATARIFDVNLVAAVRTVDLGLGLMGPRGQGTVAAVSSLAGLRPMGAAPAYSSSKGALIAYLRAIHGKASRVGVRVVDIQPGFVRTPMTDRNRFAMPFLLEPADAARRTVRGLQSGSRVISYPRRLAWPTRLFARFAPELLWRRFAGG